MITRRGLICSPAVLVTDAAPAAGMVSAAAVARVVAQYAEGMRHAEELAPDYFIPKLHAASAIAMNLDVFAGGGVWQEFRAECERLGLEFEKDPEPFAKYPDIVHREWPVEPGGGL